MQFAEAYATQSCVVKSLWIQILSGFLWPNFKAQVDWNLRALIYHGFVRLEEIDLSLHVRIMFCIDTLMPDACDWAGSILKCNIKDNIFVAYCWAVLLCVYASIFFHVDGVLMV